MKIGDIIRYTDGGLIGIIVDICPAPFKGGPPWITVAFPAGVSSPMSSYGFEIMSPSYAPLRDLEVINESK